jgi:hypothetical protein
MEAPKCPSCGKREWSHVCSGTTVIRVARPSKSDEPAVLGVPEAEAGVPAQSGGCVGSASVSDQGRIDVGSSDAVVDPLPEPASGSVFDRKAYMRRYMKKYMRDWRKGKRRKDSQP